MGRVSVAFANMVDPGWLAGGQYLFNLLYALKAFAPDVERVLRVLPGTSPESYKMLDDLFDRTLEFPPSLPAWTDKLPKLIKKHFTPYLLQEDRLLRKNHIDAQFTRGNPGNAKRVPAAIWLPDFQHLHYPDLFTKEDVEFRMHVYPKIARKARSVVLSSQSAFDDLKRVAPDVAHKARILNFVAQVESTVYDNDSAAIIEHFRLPQKFFFLPNQFWQHKNHRIVIQALALACHENRAITVVCTGGVYDHRNPTYFDTILNDIATLGLQSNMRILGRVSRQNFYMLMRQSLAVIQPSLFEGWSTTIEEAKSLGKQIVLSDIPVHREQNPPAGLFFDPQQPEQLALLLMKLFQEKEGGPDFALEQQARHSLPMRTKQFADTFQKIVMEMLET